ncbi:MAG: hypothetical protein J5922_01680 [Clostridia bacterium]|nr:hypothetical protein [Clostridia bacterium]
MDRERFLDICKTTELQNGSLGIGTYSEKLLHAALKRYYCPDLSKHEIKVAGSVADIVNENDIIEVQTGGMFPLKKKIPKFLDNGYRVTVVYPIAEKKWLIWIDPETGAMTDRRKSPKLGTDFLLLCEQIHLLPLLKTENLSFRTVKLEIEEYRIQNGWGNGGKRGSQRADRLPVDIYSETDFSKKSDYYSFISPALADKFTVRDFSKESKLTRHRAYAALRVLETLEVIEKCGKNGRENLYKRLF